VAVDALGRDLAALMAAGDPDAVRRLYDAYGRLVYSITYRILGDHGRAEEATQTAFTKVWQAASRIDPDRDIRPLLLTAARRVAFDLIDHERRRPTGYLEDAVTEPAVDDTTERLTTEWHVQEALGQLTEDEREVARLQHLDGFTHQEIADRLGLPIGTVKSRSHRAHKKLIMYLRAAEEGS
jgi:RNA polymerase sigma-70 factor (ECF subfamily)